MYNKVADSGDVVIQGQGISIVDIHEPAIAMPLPPLFLHAMNRYPHRNKIFLIRRHQELRRRSYYITLRQLVTHLRDVAQQKTYMDPGYVLSSESSENSLPSASLQSGDILRSIYQGD